MRGSGGGWGSGSVASVSSRFVWARPGHSEGQATTSFSLSPSPALRLFPDCTHLKLSLSSPCVLREAEKGRRAGCLAHTPAACVGQAATQVSVASNLVPRIDAVPRRGWGRRSLSKGGALAGSRVQEDEEAVQVPAGEASQTPSAVGAAGIGLMAPSGFGPCRLVATGVSGGVWVG